MKVIIKIFVLLLIINVQAQLPQAFIQNASIQHDDAAFDVAIGQDGTVFVAFGSSLRAYHYEDTMFVQKTYINFNGEAQDIAIGSEGTIFVACMWEGLRAYTFNGQSFTNTAHIHNDGDAHGVAVGPDGTIFLANLWDGLRAYTYNGSSFTHTAHVNTNGDAHDVAVGPDGTIFVANAWEGLRAYTYNGSAFSFKARINDGNENDRAAFKVVVDSNGTIFLGNGRDGLRAYNYNGSSFTNTAHINNGGEAWGIGINSEGTIFLANNFDGLRAYIYDGNSFINTAHIYEGNYARDLAIGSDGTIFLANLWGGVFSYTYTGYGNIPFFFVIPNYGFQNNLYSASINGINTHFSDGQGTSQVWISRADLDIQATNFQVHSNTSMDVQFTIPPDLPIGLWDMNIKTSIDSVLTLKKGVDIVIEGNYALTFDGINDYGVIPAHDSLNMEKSSVSISVWIKSSESSNNEQVIIEHDNFWDNPGSYQLTSWDSNHLRFGFPNINEDIEYIVNFTDGRWHHIVGMLDSENNKARLYYDGKLVVEKIVNGEIEASMAPTYIGSGGGDDRFFKGEIDEVRIWRKALTLQEIHANMYRHLSGAEDGLVGYWPFNENSGNIVNDLSGNTNHGTIYGAIHTGSGAPIGTIMMFCHPNYGYQNHNFFTLIQGANTHFSSGIKNIWLSKEDKKINFERYHSDNNTQINVKFYIPQNASLGQWGINVETMIDSVITMPFGIEVLPPPSVTSQNSSNTSWQRSVFAVNDETCWSVGDDGTIQKTTDRGITWESQNSGTSNVLNSTYFANEITGWAVGQYGTILNTTDGGSEWKSQTSGTSNNLQSVYFIDSNVGWTVGRSGTILKTINSGSTWESQTSGSTSWLYSVYFVSGTHGWVVGSNGTILTTTNGGETWGSQISGTTNYLSSVHFDDINTGWIAGSKGVILKTTDGGKNWQAINSGTNEWLKSVVFINANTGWAAGSGGILIMTEDGGATWSPRRTWTQKTLNSVFFADEISGWVVGETGTILNLMMNNLATKIDRNNLISSLPSKFELFQNYPNPFNPVTIINYELRITSEVELNVYNILGQKVISLVSERQNARHHQVEWNASGFASGIYYYQLKAGEFQDVKKMILLR
jgi:photosystem II stability/assembly factor-like uncharacterized protein